MSDLPALDVAIGLIFLFFVLALVASTINEALAAAVGLRARFLQTGLLNLLSSAPQTTEAGIATARAFYRHPLIQTMIRPGHGPDPAIDPTQITKWWRRPPYPSYVPSRTFVAALTDIAETAESALSKADQKEAEAARVRMAAAAAGLERSLASIPNTYLSEALLAVYRSAGNNAERFQHAAEQWFDDSMERVSGWYKRRVQLILLVIATVIVVLLNADALSSGRVLWRDDALRAAVVKKAEDTAEGPLTDVEIDTAVKQLDLPLGWDLSFGDEATQLPNDGLAWAAKLVGLALTIIAVLLGAPFWFDLLSKVMRVRATGAPPPASDAVRKGDAEQPRAGPAGPA